MRKLVVLELGQGISIPNRDLYRTALPTLDTIPPSARKVYSLRMKNAITLTISLR